MQAANEFQHLQIYMVISEIKCLIYVVFYV